MEYDNKELTLNNVEEILSLRIRPTLALHGGNIIVSSIKDNVIYVQLTGQCSNCTSSDVTINELVNKELKAAFPTILSVQLVTGVSNELLAEAREILSRRRNDC